MKIKGRIFVFVVGKGITGEGDEGRRMRKSKITQINEQLSWNSGLCMLMEKLTWKKKN